MATSPEDQGPRGSRHYPIAQLTAWAADLLAVVGAPRPVAGTVARHLVGADAAGHRGHGLAMLPTYLDAIDAGELRPDAEPALVEDRGAHLIVDGRHGFGHHALSWTLTLVIDKARQYGLAGAHLVRGGHVGRLGGYVLDGAAQSAAALITVGSVADDADALVAPHGGRGRLLGTNPIAFGCPGDPPFVLDMATSTMAYYDLVLMAAAGEQVPPGVLVGAAPGGPGPADDPLAGGGMLPFGGHKGYGLSLLAGVLSGLATAGTGDDPGDDEGLRGVFVLAIDQRGLTVPGRIDAALARVRASEPVDPLRPVQVPGDRAAALRARSEERGVSVPPDLVERIRGWLGRHDRVLPRLPGPLPDGPAGQLAGRRSG
jgi:LDH2 family malate/lactate/ureidoglycolate dehydrogenase